MGASSCVRLIVSHLGQFHDLMAGLSFFGSISLARKSAAAGRCTFHPSPNGKEGGAGSVFLFFFFCCCCHVES